MSDDAIIEVMAEAWVDAKTGKPAGTVSIGDGMRAALAAIRNTHAVVPQFQIAQLRHAYAQLAAGTVRDQKSFADGLISPVIQASEDSAHD